MLEYKEEGTYLDCNVLKQRVLKKGFSEEILQQTIKHYALVGIIAVNEFGDVCLLNIAFWLVYAYSQIIYNMKRCLR